MAQLNPALIITVGEFADGIAAQIKKSLCRAHGVGEVPAVFQFVRLSGKADEDDRAILEAYALALGERAIADAGESLRMPVAAERLETFIITLLRPGDYALARRASAAVRECSIAAISGGLNAVFLVSKRLLSLDAGELNAAARRLDSDMASKEFPFNRCFFVDEFNESGQTVTAKEHITELVADYVVLSIASEISDALRQHLPLYMGEGAHHISYGSFCWNRIQADGKALTDLLLPNLASKIIGGLFIESQDDGAAKTLGEAAGGWFADNFSRALERTGQDRDAPRRASQPRADTPTNMLAGTGADWLKELPAFRHDSEAGLDRFCLEACAWLNYNLHLYGGFLEACLEQAMVELERQEAELETLKTQINETLIKILLNDRPQCEEPPPRPPRRRPCWLSRCFYRGKRSLYGRKRVTSIPPPSVSSKTLEDILREQERLYDYRRVLIDEHLDLYKRLDMAYAGVERFRQFKYQPKSRTRAGVFDIDLVDEEFAGAFYASGEYATRKGDIECFTAEEKLPEFVGRFFSYPYSDPAAFLLKYCQDRLDSISNYSIGRMLQLKSLLKGKRRLSVSAPFWKPQLFGAAEKLRIISMSGGDGLDINSIFDSTSTTTRPILIITNGEPEMNEGCLTVVQVSYGRQIESIFDISLGDE